MSGFSIRNAKALELVGGLAWSGDVYHSGHKVGTVSNDGNGGCCNWYWYSRAAQRDFTALAASRYADHPEAIDMLAGDLWDAAMLAGN